MEGKGRGLLRPTFAEVSIVLKMAEDLWAVKIISVWHTFRCSNSSLTCGSSGDHCQPCMGWLMVGSSIATSTAACALKLYTCILMTKYLIHITMNIIHIVFSRFQLCHWSSITKKKHFACRGPTLPLHDGEHFCLDGAMSGNSVLTYTYRLNAIQWAKSIVTKLLICTPSTKVWICHWLHLGEFLLSSRPSWPSISQFCSATWMHWV